MSVLLAERDGAVAVARLNRPDARNALSAEVMEELAALVEGWDLDPEIRCIVIAGSDDYFAAGADIKAMAERTFDEVLTPPPRRSGLASPRSDAMIAAVSDYALGAAASCRRGAT